MTAMVQLKGKAHTVPETGVVIGALVLMIFVTFLSMLLSDRLMKVLGITGANVIARVSGIFLAALAMQFIFDGLSASRLFS
jgi:multiple antibiotic resistance protein